jgi:NAD(P)-dependent dehydrogenase (short-subunit alcohol dehydrogenase family)
VQGVNRLNGKVAMVTGGAGGIGSATARALAREGAAVIVLDINEERATQVAEEIVATGGAATAIAVDLAVEAQVEAAMDSVVETFGRLDILHNNAALTDAEFLARDTLVTEMEIDVWERTIAVNLTSQMLTCKYAIPHMVKNGGGSIINMSSGASLIGDQTRTAYGVSKAGVNTLTMYAATGHGKQGIRVNTIVPGLIITDAVKAHLTEDMVKGLSRATLTPYVGEPNDIAYMVVFLASDESKYITGQMFMVDGGMTAHSGNVGRNDKE